MSSEFNLFDCLKTIDEFRNLVEGVTPTVLATFNTCRYEPFSMTELDFLKWPTHKSILCCKVKNELDTVIYESEFMDVTEDKINKYFTNEGDLECSKE